MTHSFLMIGQSNMAGRGRFDEVPPIKNPNLLMLRNGRWLQLKEPVNYDRPVSGIGLAPAFADEYEKKFKVKTGLIPCADGGTSLDDWAVNGQLYNHAVAQTKLAQKINEVKGILWHQGENDSDTEEHAQSYRRRFIVILSSLMDDCSLKGIPVIMGELGEFLIERKDTHQYFKLVNQELVKIAASHKYIGLASAAGLTANEGTIPGMNNIHFDSVSYREFGRRYFQVYLILINQ